MALYTKIDKQIDKYYEVVSIDKSLSNQIHYLKVIVFLILIFYIFLIMKLFHKFYFLMYLWLVRVLFKLFIILSFFLLDILFTSNLFISSITLESSVPILSSKTVFCHFLIYFYVHFVNGVSHYFYCLLKNLISNQSILSNLRSCWKWFFIVFFNGLWNFVLYIKVFFNNFFTLSPLIRWKACSRRFTPSFRLSLGSPPFNLFFLFLTGSFEFILCSFEVIWAVLGSHPWRELLSKFVVLKFFARLLVLFGWILYGESIFISFLYLFKVLDERPNWFAISDCFIFGFSHLTRIKSAIKFSLYWRDNKLGSRLSVLKICCKEKLLFI